MTVKGKKGITFLKSELKLVSIVLPLDIWLSEDRLLTTTKNKAFIDTTQKMARLTDPSSGSLSPIFS